MGLYFFLLGAGVISRLIPHAWNFTPVTSVAIFAAIYLSKREAVVLPLAIRFVSDAIIGFFSLPLMMAVYGSHLFGVVMGRWVRKKKTLFRLIVGPLLSATIFFLVTNFAWFYESYPHTFHGILQSYMNGLPFFRGTLLGDVFYTLVLVGGYECILAFQSKRRLQISIS